LFWLLRLFLFFLTRKLLWIGPLLVLRAGFAYFWG
jgi:hypothetical protein